MGYQQLLAVIHMIITVYSAPQHTIIIVRTSISGSKIYIHTIVYACIVGYIFCVLFM